MENTPAALIMSRVTGDLAISKSNNFANPSLITWSEQITIICYISFWYKAEINWNIRS